MHLMPVFYALSEGFPLDRNNSLSGQEQLLTCLQTVGPYTPSRCALDHFKSRYSYRTDRRHFRRSIGPSSNSLLLILRGFGHRRQFVTLTGNL